MSYNNNYGGPYDDYPGRGNWGRDYQNRGYQRPYRKKSGAKTGRTKEGKPWVSAWKKSKQGLISIIGSPSDKTRSSQSKSGRNWETWNFKFTNKNTGQIWWVWGMVDVDAMKVHFSDLNLIVNPNAQNGGYFGRRVSKNRR